MARLMVIVARRAEVAVILRRGPATWTEVIRWDTRTDRFDRGHWFHGRLYERRADLSPSGDRLVYFVAKHHLQAVDPTYTRSWTAVSRPPWLTAQALWPNLGTTYHGGGLFADERTLELNAVSFRWSNPERDRPAGFHPAHPPPADLRVQPIAFTSGDQLQVVRLCRDGWSLASADPALLRRDMKVPPARLLRPLPRTPWDLELQVGHQELSYRLVERGAGAGGPALLEGAEWADLDPAGRLCFARHGRLLAARLDPARGWMTEELADFSADRPRRLPPVDAQGQPVQARRPRGRVSRRDRR